jgi:hypothetical protein
MLLSKMGDEPVINALNGSFTFGFRIHGKLGWSGGFGFGRFGGMRFGEKRRIGGIYQRRRRGYNNHTGPPGPNTETYFVLMRSYQPTNPQTVPQQANRAKITAGVIAWQSLTTEQKHVYNERASKNSRRGYNLFMSEYLKTH